VSGLSRSTIESTVRARTTGSGTFVDPVDEARYATAGYLLIERPILAVDEIQGLVELWTSREARRSGMVFDYLNEDRSILEAITAAMAPLWRERLPMLREHTMLFTTCVAKFPGAGTSMGFHDDRTFVDERHHAGVTIWIPLCDVGPELDNGTLRIVPGSHALGQPMAGPNTQPWFGGYEEFLSAHSTPVRLPAGGALLSNNRLLHGSGPNRSDRPRLALVAAAIPAGAVPVQVEATCDGALALRNVDLGFFLRHPPEVLRTRFPSGYPCTEVLDDTEPSVPTIEVLAGRLGAPVPSPDRPSFTAALVAATTSVRSGATTAAHVPSVAAVPGWMRLTDAGRAEVQDLMATNDAVLPAALAYPDAMVEGDVRVLVVSEGQEHADLEVHAPWLRSIVGHPGVAGVRVVRLGSSSAVGPIRPTSGRHTIAVPLETPSVRGGLLEGGRIRTVQVGRLLEVPRRPHGWCNEPGGPCTIVLVDVVDPRPRARAAARTSAAGRRARQRWRDLIRATMPGPA